MKSRRRRVLGDHSDIERETGTLHIKGGVRKSLEKEMSGFNRVKQPTTNNKIEIAKNLNIGVDDSGILEDDEEEE